MRKSALFLAVVLAASIPSVAMAKGKVKKVKAKPRPVAAATVPPGCDAGCRLVGAGIQQIFIPFQQIFGITATAPVVARY